MAAKKIKRKRKSARLSPDERKRRKLKADHIRSVRTVFKNLGFDRADELSEFEVSVGGQTSDLDDVFVRENVIVLAEYTTSQSSDVTSHLKNKKIFFSNIFADPKAFLGLLRSESKEFDERLGSAYHAHRYRVRLVYCSYNSYDVAVQTTVHEPKYLDYPILKYFEKHAGTIKVSALPEMLAFLQIPPNEVARDRIFPNRSASTDYDGSILPEASSGFPEGYKVVSFYVDAAALLERAYVLRRDGWRGSFQAYQRMVMPSKIEAIRKSLKTHQRVFVNNLIATLPPDVHPQHADGKTVDIKKLTETAPVNIRLPLRANSIGLIDGQHRLFSYYETRDDDAQIAALRNQQNLLLTGIIYPPTVSQAEKELFEAALFLTINSNQTNASTPLRQEIEVFLSPSSSTAIGRQVMQRLAKTGPLAGHVETYFFEKGKLKTSSVVSYGLASLIKLGGDDSLFKLFTHPDKEKIVEGKAGDALEAYLQFAVTHINTFLGAVKANVAPDRWTSDPGTKDRLLTVTYVNSFLITMRLLIRNQQSLAFSTLNKRLNGIGAFKFSSYHSSQYGRMAEQIYQRHFAPSS